MLKRPLGAYVGLGRKLNYLRLCRDDYLIHGAGHIIDNFDKLNSNLEKLNLNISKKVLLKKTDKIISTLRELPINNKIGKNSAEVRKAINIFEATLSAEISDRYAFETTPKLLDIEKLMDNPKELFNISAWDKLSTQIKIDLSASAKCHAFELHTASAFHLMRAVEELLKEFYLSKVEEKDRVEKPWMWGKLLKSLEKKNITGFENILPQMTAIKDLYRNPTQHPDKNYDADEISNLWLVCIEAINRMAKEL